MIWSAFVASTRMVYLGEEAGTEGDSRWSDDLMLAIANSGLQQLSMLLPLPSVTGVAAVADQEEYDLPANFMSITAVIFPEGTARIERPGPIASMLPGWGYDISTGSRFASFFWVYDKTLHLLPPPTAAVIADSEVITIYYSRSREEVVDGVDGELDLEYDEIPILQEYVRAECNARVVTPDAMLSRWKEKGNRDDNPLLPSAKRFYEHFYEMVETKQHYRMTSEVVLVPASPRRRMYGRR